MPALPYADGSLRRQVRDARSVLIEDRVQTLASLQQLEPAAAELGNRQRPTPCQWPHFGL
jgi:hypothetical protein